MTLQGQVVDIIEAGDGEVEVRMRFAPPSEELEMVHRALSEAIRVGQPITIAFGTLGFPKR